MIFDYYKFLDKLSSSALLFCMLGALFSIFALMADETFVWVLAVLLASIGVINFIVYLLYSLKYIKIH